MFQSGVTRDRLEETNYVHMAFVRREDENVFLVYHLKNGVALKVTYK